MKHCISCGAVMDDDALFCRFCGTKVEQSDELMTPKETSSDLEKDRKTGSEQAASCVEDSFLTTDDCSDSLETNREEDPSLNTGEPRLQNDSLQSHPSDFQSTTPAAPTVTKKTSKTLVIACVSVAIFAVIAGIVIAGVLSKTNSSKPTNGNEQNVSTTSTSLKTSSEVIDEKAYPFDYVPSKSEVLARIKKTFENYGYDFSSYDLTTFAEATNGNGVLVGKNGWGTAMVSYSHGMVAVGFQNQALANDVFSAIFADCPNMPTPQYMIDNFDKHFVSFSENNYFADYECGVRVIKVKTTGQCSFSYSDDQVKSNWKTITFNSSAKKNDASGTTVPSNGSASATTAVVSADGGLNLRAEPSTDGQKLALIPDGKQVDVLETQNGWSKVVYNGTTGWCKSEYLLPDGGGESAAPPLVDSFWDDGNLDPDEDEDAARRTLRQQEERTASTTTTAPQPKSQPVATTTTEANPCADGHSWEAVTKTVHHDEIGHYEPVYEDVNTPTYECPICKDEFDTFNEYYAHYMAAHNESYPWTIFGSRDYRVKDNWSKQETDEKYWVVDREAYDEEVILYYRCSVCKKRK